MASKPLWQQALETTAGGYFGYKEYQDQQKQADFERNLELARQSTEAARAQSEQLAQQRALADVTGMSQDLKKWLGWAIAGLAAVSSLIAVSSLFRGRKRRG